MSSVLRSGDCIRAAAPGLDLDRSLKIEVPENPETWMGSLIGLLATTIPVSPRSLYDDTCLPAFPLRRYTILEYVPSPLFVAKSG
jgi:hypothetical protein